VRRLLNASRFFGAGLALLLITVLAFPLLSTIAPARNAVRMGPTGPQGPPGRTGRTVRIVVRPKVRAVLAARVMHALPGRRLRVRYALTQPSVVMVSVEREGHKVGGRYLNPRVSARTRQPSVLRVLADTSCELSLKPATGRRRTLRLSCSSRRYVGSTALLRRRTRSVDDR
jgi:hypothetical protein